MSPVEMELFLWSERGRSVWWTLRLFVSLSSTIELQGRLESFGSMANGQSDLQAPFPGNNLASI